MGFLSTKTFPEYPCARRNWRAAENPNCRLIHGYSLTFVFTFEAEKLDAAGFVVDFGGLGWMWDVLEDQFDHKLLVCEDDPLWPALCDLQTEGGCTLRRFPGVSCEELANWLLVQFDSSVRRRTSGRAWIRSVEVRENAKNSALYRLDQPADQQRRPASAADEEEVRPHDLAIRVALLNAGLVSVPGAGPDVRERIRAFTATDSQGRLTHHDSGLPVTVADLRAWAKEQPHLFRLG